MKQFEEESENYKIVVTYEPRQWVSTYIKKNGKWRYMGISDLSGVTRSEFHTLENRVQKKLKELTNVQS